MTSSHGSGNEILLNIEGLQTHFFTEAGTVRAVDGVSLMVRKGETLGIVGESGCGKSVTALSILRLIPNPPGKIVGGRILLEERDLLRLPEHEMRKVRGASISMIFQEPMTSLNPVFTAGDQIAEGIRLHQRLSKRESWNKAIEMLRVVRIPDPERRVGEYPHQMSGGMRQRVMIAMALSCNPQLLIADEPTTALDVTIQAQILELLNQLKSELGMAVMLITHDLGVVADTAARVAVMYAGRVVEEAPVLELFTNPLHPYTQGLLNSIPRLEKTERRARLQAIPGMVPDLLDLPRGCKFQARCPKVFEPCSGEEPELKTVSAEHRVRCYLY
ncbi:MAG: peptide ABC transporter ATP-binding protein [candidate division NC10 bacterium RIFCSPLOWO2_12_FULL_66_18]|nr:MAG: peptide ABC transporter ATP-binding protein [candidate division NC10 bacterium RIFCSPLOWO2_12_FULL_66_18]